MEATNKSYKLILQDFKSFDMSYCEISPDAIEIDVAGTGVLIYCGQLSKEVLIDFNTCVNKALKNYSQLTGHCASKIGYSFSLVPTKKYHHPSNTFVTSISMSIIFQKPILNASSYELLPTIILLTKTILENIFISPSGCNHTRTLGDQK